MEEAGEVELEVVDMLVSLSAVGMNEGGSQLTDEASNAREMVCWARVMVAIVGGSS